MTEATARRSLRRVGLFLFQLLVAFGAVIQGCSRPCSLEPVRCSRLPDSVEAGAAVEREEGLSHVSEGRIYLDLSESMRGFIGDTKDGMSFTLFQRGLDGPLEEAFASAGVEHPSLLGFGNRLRRDLPPLPSFVVAGGGASPRRLYSELQTDLGVAIRDIGRAPNVLSVIVTDGDQDLRVTSSGGVGQGFVRTALVRLVREELMKRGFGVWLVGVMSDFGDCYYNVRPDRQGRVGRCIKVRHRPAYYWVFSRDFSKGRKLVRYLVRDLHAESPGVAPSPVEALELWPGAFPSVRFEPVTGEELVRIAMASPLDRSRLASVLSWRIPEHYPGATSACLNLPWVPGQTVQLAIDLRRSPGDVGIGDLVPNSIWDTRIEPPRGLPSFRAREVETSPNGASLLLLEFSHDEATGLNPRSAIEIPIILYPDFARGLERSWVGKWTTADDASSETVEGRTLYLADVVEGILQAQLPVPRPIACLHLELMR